MRYLKNSIVILIFINCLNQVMNNFNILALFIVSLITIIFCIKYMRLLAKLEYAQTITKLKLNKQREYFIESLSHDLRIPTIAQLRGLELLRKNSIGELNISQLELINQIESSCKCALNMISLLINTYNIENSNHELYFEKFNISELIYSCFEELSYEAKEKNLTFEYLDFENNIIEADKSEIYKVLLNLLSNAICYSQSNAKITVSVKKYPKKIRVIISGDKALYSDCKLSERYTTIGQSIRMYFCKKIIEFHNGKITQNKNMPQNFMFEIPRFTAV